MHVPSLRPHPPAPLPWGPQQGAQLPFLGLYLSRARAGGFWPCSEPEVFPEGRVGTWPQVPTRPLVCVPGLQLQEVAEPGLGGQAGSVLSSWLLTLGVTVSESLHPSPPHLSSPVWLKGEWETKARHTEAGAPQRGASGTTSHLPLESRAALRRAFLLCGLPGNAELPAKLTARTWLQTHL